MPRKATSKAVNLDFTFFTHLWDFYSANKGSIRQHYRALTKRFLDYNDPTNATAFLRQPQFEALEMYVFLKEFLHNQPIHTIFQNWSEQNDPFQGRTIRDKSGQIQLDILQEATKTDYDKTFKAMRANARIYANYIFALTMGVGKTILMATCIFYEFLLANKFPKDEKYCHNALVFAPDKTVLQSLRELESFDMTRVVPPEYAQFLTANIKFHFLDDSGATLTVIDQSRFNVIVSNTQKIILKRQNTVLAPLEKLFKSGKPTHESQAQSIYDRTADLYDIDGPDDDVSLTTNQRFQKLTRITQLGIYIDEAHHAFGNKLASDMGVKKTKTSLRTTVDELAASLKRSGTRVVACYNFTGTPYIGTQILPEVVYGFGLKNAIAAGYLKTVAIKTATNTRTTEFVGVAIADFLKHTSGQRYEGMLPKLAFFAATIDELQKDLKPAVEAALLEHGIGSDRILVNVGDSKLTTNDEIREFNRLDTPTSEKQFILLVNKGREGWNCRSLFGVALYRKPKSKVFVLQATMRCLRSISNSQQTGRIYISDENKKILESELQQNFRVSLADIEQTGKDREEVIVKVLKQEKITLQRVRHQYTLKERQVGSGINLELDQAVDPANTEKYRLTVTTQSGLSFSDAQQSKKTTEDITYIREKRSFSPLLLTAEISRYLNKSPLFIAQVLEQSVEGMEAIVAAVNEYNELLYDWVIPRLFKILYDVEGYEKREQYEVELVKLSDEGFYRVSAPSDRVVRSDDAMAQKHADKSFHLDTYCFDSLPEQNLFWKLIADKRINKIYFTGMLTHGQSEFYIQYIDPDSHTIRSYYPDFLFQKEDGKYVIVEVKGDNMIDDPVVQAKKEFAEKMADSNSMQYHMIKGSDANQGNYQSLFS